MKKRLKRYDLYTILTLVLIALAVFFLWTSWVLVPVTVALAVQYEFVYINVAVIIRQYVMVRQKKLTEMELTKFQSFLRRLFKI